jgi:hypothetical protein
MAVFGTITRASGGRPRLEVRFAIRVTGDQLGINDAIRQTDDMIAECRESAREIPTIARVEPHILAVLVNLQTPAIEFDLVNPTGIHWRSLAENRAARRNDAGRTGDVGSRNRVSKTARLAAKPHKRNERCEGAHRSWNVRRGGKLSGDGRTGRGSSWGARRTATAFLRSSKEKPTLWKSRKLGLGRRSLTGLVQTAEPHHHSMRVKDYATLVGWECSCSGSRSCGCTLPLWSRASS